MSKLIQKPIDKYGSKRFIYGIKEVSPVQIETIPQYNVQNYLEMQDIRFMLNNIKDHKISHAADIGCGYGRLTMVLGEYAKKVFGFEREAHFVYIAKTLLPGFNFIQIENLWQIPIKEGFFDFLMAVTVLQHCTNDDTRLILNEIKRLVNRGGYVLLIEKTNTSDCYGNSFDRNQFFSIGRSIETHEDWMLPFKLIKTKRRTMVPTHFKKDAFTCMLFKMPE